MNDADDGEPIATVQSDDNQDVWTSFYIAVRQSHNIPGHTGVKATVVPGQSVVVGDVGLCKHTFYIDTVCIHL